ncbi:MAG: hypothetical protein H0X51_00790 [Parachlamydiaceae bacterium]|nr:hypothetical protein [Parachlamydiaceae bacterium]
MTNVKPPFLLFILAALFVTFPTQTRATWATTTLQEMSIEEKIGQLFMIAAYVDADYAEKEIGNPHIIQEIDTYLCKYHIGGLAYVGPSSCQKQVSLTNHYQQLSKYPILIAQDLEWGLAMRLTDGMCFPKNSTLGAVEDELIYETGKEIGRQARLIGVHMNLSPVLDVNMTSENPAINIRSFGDNPLIVAEKGVAMIRGLQDGGVIASAKHFPGLGDITVDPHLGLPKNLHSIERLNRVELYPFREAIKAGVGSIQTEHLVIPAIEPSINLPSSLSYGVVTKLLKQEMGFHGLILSGALRMKALTNHLSEEEITLNAFLAGSDMLLMPQDISKAYKTIYDAFKNGIISERDLDERLLKILNIKEGLHLHQNCLVEAPTMEQMQPQSAHKLKRKLFESAVAFLRKDEQMNVPLSSQQEIPYIQIGNSSTNTLFEQLNQRLNLRSFFFSLEHANREEQQDLLDLLESYPRVILAVYPGDPRRIEQIRLLSGIKQESELKQFRVHGLTTAAIEFATLLQKYQHKIIVAYFGNPYGLPFFNAFSNVLMAYEQEIEAQTVAGELLRR